MRSSATARISAAIKGPGSHARVKIFSSFRRDTCNERFDGFVLSNLRGEKIRVFNG
jgi:hypothetical protein